MPGSQSVESEHENDLVVREVCANGLCMETTEVEEKLNEGNIQEAESSLCEGLSLNFEVGWPKIFEIKSSHFLFK